MAITYAVPPCTPEDVIEGPIAEWERQWLEPYFKFFDQPRMRTPDSRMPTRTVWCSCGQPLNGYSGNIDWVDVVEDEGDCGVCGRPLRVVHSIPGSQLVIKTVPLLYRVGL